MSLQPTLMLVLVAASLSYGHEQRYCGRNLARAIDLLCTKARVGKRMEGTMYNSILSPYYREQEEPPYRFPGLVELPWPHYKSSALSLQSRGKRPVADECCNKPCSDAELLSYCY